MQFTILKFAANLTKAKISFLVYFCFIQFDNLSHASQDKEIPSNCILDTLPAHIRVFGVW